MKHSSYYTLEGLLQRLLASINSPRTCELIPQLTSQSPAEKIARAASVFRRLVDEEPNSALKPCRSWSLDYFEACAEGARARRQFLVDEGVFAHEERLTVPERVKPQMEIGNLEPSRYSGPFAEEVGDLARLMFHEYFGVKNMLSLPDPADLVAWLTQHLPFARRLGLPPPRLKLSLLVRDYVEEVISKTRRSSDPPLVAAFGPGKGEELVPLIEKGLSILCLDAHSSAFLRDLHLDTFRQAAIDTPRIVVLGEKDDVDASELGVWQRRGCMPTLFVYAGVDVTKDDLIPETLRGAASVAASIYMLHELERKEAFFANMATISRGSIVVFDSYPSTPGLDRVILPVSQQYGLLVTGHDAVVSHILSHTPAEMEAVARKAVPRLDWRGVEVGPPVPPPFFYRLQGAVIGRHFRRGVPRSR
jgi:hypothetical protein